MNKKAVSMMLQTLGITVLVLVTVGLLVYIFADKIFKADNSFSDCTKIGYCEEKQCPIGTQEITSRKCPEKDKTTQVCCRDIG